MQKVPTSSRLRRLPAALAVMSLVLAGCGDGAGGDDSTAKGESLSSSEVELLGAPDRATGSPVVIAVNNTGKNAAIDQSSENVAIRALVKYANEYLGGINGHVIQLQECDHGDTPAKAIDCANQAVDAKVAAVLQGSGDDHTVKIAAAAGIPVVLGLGATPTSLSTPNVFSLGNGLGVYGAPAGYAREKGYKSAAIVVIDVPAASGPAKQLGAAFFAKAGSSLEVVPIAPGQADMSPQVQATLDKKPEMY